MRAAALLESDPAAAARRAAGILAGSPGHPEAHLLLAAAHRKLGDSAAAATVLETLTRTRPDSALLQLELGRAYAAGGRSGEALAALRLAVALDAGIDRKSTRLNSSHRCISYAVFCLKKKHTG